MDAASFSASKWSVRLSAALPGRSHPARSACPGFTSRLSGGEFHSLQGLRVLQPQHWRQQEEGARTGAPQSWGHFWRAQDRADGKIWPRSGDSGTSQDPRLQAVTPNATGVCRLDRAEITVKPPGLWKCKALCCFGIHAFYWRGLHF